MYNLIDCGYIYIKTVDNVKVSINFADVYYNKQILNIMASYIKPIPVLSGRSAEVFESKIRKNYSQRGSVDFSYQVKQVQFALTKSSKSTF